MNVIKSIVLFGLLSVLIPSQVSAKTVTKNEIKKTYDSDHGWWWYEEEIKDEDNKTKKLKYKMSPAAKKKLESEKKTQKLLQKLIEIQTIQVQLTQDVKDRLDYAFPNTTSKYTINKKTGEKCLTNSSMDCFEMPVIAEGQHVPALQEFLKNPSPENSKKWLQWQGTYFNHINDVSHGLRFAFLKDGAEAYPTETAYVYGDSLFNPASIDLKVNREEKVLLSMKEDLAFLIFIGDSTQKELNTNIFVDLTNMNSGFMKKLEKVLIFSTKEKLEAMDRYVEDVLLGEQKLHTTYKVWKELKKTVRPKLYEKYSIKLTPTTVLYYKNKKMNKGLYQIISIGNLTRNELRNNSLEFLKYAGIIDRKEFSSDKNWNVLEKRTILNKDMLELPKGNKPKKEIGEISK